MFDPAMVKGEQIREDNPYHGVRLMVRGLLGTAKVTLQVDVGFGDAVSPAPEEVVFPSLLGLPEARLKAYHWKTVIAEKFQAMVHLGMENTRMKDLFDIWNQARTGQFEAGTLRRSLQATLERRGTDWPSEPPLALTEAFGLNEQKQAQWKAFLRKGGLDEEIHLGAVIQEIQTFLWPLFQEDGLQDTFIWSGCWHPPVG